MVKSEKNTLRLLYILAAVVVGLLVNGLFTVGQASPYKERVKIGAREIILGDAGDSGVGNRKPAANKSNATPQKSNSAPGKGAQLRFKSFMSRVEEAFEPEDTTIALAYTCIGDKVLFNKIIPAFQTYWQAKTGKQVNFVAGYSLPDFDTMATSVSGQPVQVLLMSSSTNTKTRGYSETKWQQTANKGVVYSIPQVFLVRKGNPKMIRTYADLTIPGIRVLHVNPLKGTGAGLWQIYGIYGSALKETELATGNKDQKLATERLIKTEENAYYEISEQPVVMKSFLRGVGDVIVASEFSAINAVKKNDDVELVVPPYTVLNDLAIYKMDDNISRRDLLVIDEFIDFLFTEEVQEYFAEYNFRPSNPTVLARHPEFRELDNPFRIGYLGEQTDLKKSLILGKWLRINNNRSSKVDNTTPN